MGVLLSRLHPTSQRIDGRGGDGGRDVHVRDQDGRLNAYELKSFVGRMTSSRRRMVKRSLKRAAELDPRSWTLIVPIDPNPSEEIWFHRLDKDYGFPCTWRGKTWLDDKMSAHPDIRKYFCDRASDEVLELLREVGREEAAVTGVADALGRLEGLHERLNEIDPYYRYELSTGAGADDRPRAGAILSVRHESTRVDVFEKYAGAARDRPITASAEVIIGPGEEALLEGIRSAVDYGLPVTIPPNAVSKLVLDAPAGLGRTLIGPELRLESTTVTIDEPVILTLNVLEGDDLLASWPVQLTRKTSGLKGTMFEGSDETGWLQLTLRVNPAEHEFGATLSLAPKPVMPVSLLPLLRWVSACRPPHRMALVWPDGLEMSSEVETALGEEGFVGVVEALAYLQDRSRVYFPLPLELSPETQQRIVESASLIREGHADFEWGTIDLRLKYWPKALDPLLEGQELSVVVEFDQWIDVAPGRIPIGRIRTQIESARAADPEGLRRALTDGLVPEVQLIPGGRTMARRLLVS